MLDAALKLLKDLTSNSYKAYIVGGFVRDYVLGIESKDIDITTNATPKQIKEIFTDCCLPNEEYGSVIVIKKGIRFEITTFRKESDYNDNRHPVKITYIDDLFQDLLRRDFTINTLCMDEDGNVLDYLNGIEDLNNKVISCVSNPDIAFSDDCLRILRAVRFATIFNFSISDDVIDSIKRNKYLLKNLSFYRKKMELEKIFTSTNYKNGIKLLIDLGLDVELGLKNLNVVLSSSTRSLIGIWSLLDVVDKYPFNSNELDLIHDINEAINLNNCDPLNLYKYGLYVNTVAGEIKNSDLKLINEAYSQLTIKCRQDIDIDSDAIMKMLHKSPGKYLKDIYDDIEREILYRRLINNKLDISNYIMSKYGN